MRTWKVFILIVLFVCIAATVFAAKKKDIPPWMEDIDESGRSTYLIPKGARREIVGSQVLVEAPSEYVARRLYELEEYLEGRFQKIEEEQKALREELQQLNETVETMETYPDVMKDVIRLTEDLNKVEARIDRLESQGEPEETEEDSSNIGVIEGPVQQNSGVIDAGQKEETGEEAGN